MIKLFQLVILCILFAQTIAAQDTLRIATYNSSRFDDEYGQERIPYFRTVVEAMNPDVLVLQELTSRQGADIFLNDILNDKEAHVYLSAPFESGFDMNNMVFFKSRKFSLFSNRQIKTSLRDISEYVLQPRVNKKMPQIWLYSAHLKAGNDDSNESQRLAEATILRKELDKLQSSTNFFVVGDFNFYRSTEPGFQVLVAGDGNTTGQCYDPANQIGDWHNNKKYARYHTQSTRTTSLYGGSTGGLDDRFDFILVSKALLEIADFYVLEHSYQSFGNDGLHMNTNINSGINLAVPRGVAQALYQASDHLPVVVDIVWNDPSGVAQTAEIVPESLALRSFPNPFNGRTTINFTLNQAKHVEVSIFNVAGTLIVELADEDMSAGLQSIPWNAEKAQSGLYIYRIKTDSQIEMGKMLLVK